MKPHPRSILIDRRDYSSSCALPFTACGSMLSPHVHFPPTPWLTSMRYTHSPKTYDRTPIVVPPNACQLPKRGARKLHSPLVCDDDAERGRSRSRKSGRKDGQHEESVKGSYFHPRAYEACAPEPSDVASTTFDLPSPPALVADLSPSDEHDDPVTTPSDPDISTAAATPPPTHISHSSYSLSPTPRDAAPRTPIITSSPVAFPRSLYTNIVEQTKKGPTLVCRGRKQEKVFTLEWDEGCLGGF